MENSSSNGAQTSANGSSESESQPTGERFSIRFNNTLTQYGYSVSIPDYGGGEVVPAEVYDRDSAALRERIATDMKKACIAKVRETRRQFTVETEGSYPLLVLALNDVIAELEAIELEGEK